MPESVSPANSPGIRFQTEPVAAPWRALSDWSLQNKPDFGKGKQRICTRWPCRAADYGLAAISLAIVLVATKPREFGAANPPSQRCFASSPSQSRGRIIQSEFSQQLVKDAGEKPLNKQATLLDKYRSFTKNRADPIPFHHRSTTVTWIVAGPADKKPRSVASIVIVRALRFSTGPTAHKLTIAEHDAPGSYLRLPHPVGPNSANASDSSRWMSKT